MSLLFIKNGYYVPIRIVNPILGREYPENANLLALVDTGFDGFLIIPEDIFSQLGLDILVSEEPFIRGICCKLRAKRAPIRLIFSEFDFVIDGDCLTFSGSREVIIGLDALSEIEMRIIGCKRSGEITRCL